MTLVASVANDGPDATSAETFTIELPAGTTATTATPTAGTCTTGAAVTCTIGTLANGASVNVIATIRASGAAGTLTARRSGPLPDTSAANDTATISLAAGPLSPGDGTGQTGGAGGQTGGQASQGVVAPVITGLTLKGRPTLKRGARLSFTVSQGASVKVTAARLLPGRLAAGKCKAKGKRGKRCLLPKLADTRTQTVPAGAAEIAIPAKRLKLGKVRFTVVATTPAGVASAPVTVDATVKRR